MINLNFILLLLLKDNQSVNEIGTGAPVQSGHSIIIYNLCIFSHICLCKMYITKNNGQGTPEL